MKEGTDYRVNPNTGMIGSMENWDRAQELVDAGIAEWRWVGVKHSPYRHQDLFLVVSGKTEYCRRHGRWTTWKGCHCLQHHRPCPECGPRRAVTLSDTCIVR